MSYLRHRTIYKITPGPWRPIFIDSSIVTKVLFATVYRPLANRIRIKKYLLATNFAHPQHAAAVT